MEQGKAAQLLMLLVNDPHLFEHVRRITGCKRIGRFEGDIYRMMPSSEDEESWHGEIFGHHMVEMSVDLSTRGRTPAECSRFAIATHRKSCTARPTLSPETRCSLGSLRLSSTG